MLVDKEVLVGVVDLREQAHLEQVVLCVLAHDEHAELAAAFDEVGEERGEEVCVALLEVDVLQVEEAVLVRHGEKRLANRIQVGYLESLRGAVIQKENLVCLFVCLSSIGNDHKQQQQK